MLKGAYIGHGAVRRCCTEPTDRFVEHPALKVDVQRSEPSPALKLFIIHVERPKQQLTSHSFALESP
jgi:hypothetical protein